MIARGDPLIHGEAIPRWVRVRDAVITLAAWVAVLWWTRGALLLLWDWLRAPVFELSSQRPPDWPRIWALLAPFFGVAALLAAWLFFWSRRRRHILGLRVRGTSPARLELAQHVARFGLAPGEVEALRARSIAVVRFGNPGALFELDPRDQPPG